jgi:hypothetical protein
MIEIRKIITMREAIFSELGVAASRPTIRAVGMAVIRNPFAGKFVEDLSRHSPDSQPVGSDPPSLGVRRQRNSNAGEPLTARVARRLASRGRKSSLCHHQGAPLPSPAVVPVPIPPVMPAQAVPAGSR